MESLHHLYVELLERFGHQGWWPLVKTSGTNPTKTGAIQGYHPGDYSFPKTREQRFEIAIGAILTQNTSWLNAEKAIIGLHAAGDFTPDSIIAMPDSLVIEAIRPSGYFNQKLKKVRLFCEFFMRTDPAPPSRAEILTVWGIGPETADSILLYAYKVPTFVIDAYTRRVLIHLGLIQGHESYEQLKLFFESSLPRDYRIYQEYHALLVEKAKHL